LFELRIVLALSRSILYVTQRHSTSKKIVVEWPTIPKVRYSEGPC